MPELHSEAARIFGDRVRSSRLQLGVSQEHVAELAEMHVTNVGKIERGQTNPSLSTIVALAGALSAREPGSRASVRRWFRGGRTP
jgi:transcriptional regulator with XRE-family HTH domain